MPAVCAIGDSKAKRRVVEKVTLFWHVDLAGRVSIGEGCLLGTKATVIQGVTVGAWSTIGAGAVVNRDHAAALHGGGGTGQAH